jgi:phage tail-like protein
VIVLNQVSSYLRYLPPVLWRDDPPPPAFSLSTALCVFEKILTGIDDGVAVTKGAKNYDSIEAEIGRIFRLFDPRTTPPQFLDWLASWVALTFPEPWSEYQRRKVTSEIIQVYHRRGLKAGLNQFLDVYTVADQRPRIAIDDCCKVLFTQPRPNKYAPIYTLLSQNEVTFDPATSLPTKITGVIAPLCIGLGPDGSLFLGDEGTPSTITPISPPSIWQLAPPNQFLQISGTPPAPTPVGPAAWKLEFPVALAADNVAPWNLYVLDFAAAVLGGSGYPSLYRLASPSFLAAPVLAKDTDLGLGWPVDMVFDAPNNSLLILDRGSDPYTQPAKPKIIVVSGLQTGPPVTATAHLLTTVVEPLALAILSNGKLVVTDAGSQTVPGPADLVLVDPSNAWGESSLLGTLAATNNPLIAPTGIARKDDGELFVVDVGLKALRGDLANPYVRLMASPAAVYLVNVASTPPTISRASEFGQLVFPTGMVLAANTLFIADQGDYSDTPPGRVWRARANEFGVVVHCADSRTQAQRRRIVEDMREIIEQVRPAHTYWTMLSP